MLRPSFLAQGHNGELTSAASWCLKRWVSSHLGRTIHCFEVEAASDQLERVLRAAVLIWENRNDLLNMRVEGVARARNPSLTIHFLMNLVSARSPTSSSLTMPCNA